MKINRYLISGLITVMLMIGLLNAEILNQYPDRLIVEPLTLKKGEITISFKAGDLLTLKKKYSKYMTGPHRLFGMIGSDIVFFDTNIRLNTIVVATIYRGRVWSNRFRKGFFTGLMTGFVISSGLSIFYMYENPKNSDTAFLLTIGNPAHIAFLTGIMSGLTYMILGPRPEKYEISSKKWSIYNTQ